MLCYFYQSELLNRLERYTILLTPDNNHFEVIAGLEDKGLIFRHPDSPALYPVYSVDRTLTQIDFTESLRERFGAEYDGLNGDDKDVLQVICQQNQYGAQPNISAKRAGKFLYMKKNARIVDMDAFEIFKRKVRNIFNRLEKKGLIVRRDGKKPEFILNDLFAKKT